jgi:hypothetical protein
MTTDALRDLKHIHTSMAAFPGWITSRTEGVGRGNNQSLIVLRWALQGMDQRHENCINDRRSRKNLQGQSADDYSMF